MAEDRLHGDVHRILDATEQDLGLAAHRRLEPDGRIGIKRGFHRVFTTIRITPTAARSKHAHRGHGAAHRLIGHGIAVESDALARLDASRKRFTHLEIRDHARSVGQKHDELVGLEFGADLRRLRITAAAAAVGAVDAGRVDNESVDGRGDGGVGELQLEILLAIARAGELKVCAGNISLRFHQLSVELRLDARTLCARLIEVGLLLRFFLEIGVLLIHLDVECALLDLGRSLDHRDAVLLELVLGDVALRDQLRAFLEAALEAVEVDRGGFVGEAELLALVDDIAFGPSLQRQASDSHRDIGLVEFALLLTLLNRQRLLGGDCCAVGGVDLVFGVFDLVGDFFLRKANDDIALRHADALGRDLGDDGARFQLVAHLDLLLRRQFAADWKHHVKRTFLDRMHIARGDGLRGGFVGPAAATAGRHRERGDDKRAASRGEKAQGGWMACVHGLDLARRAGADLWRSVLARIYGDVSMRPGPVSSCTVMPGSGISWPSGVMRICPVVLR